MKTFYAVNDALLMSLISRARRRIVFVSPGLSLPIAEALGQRFEEIDGKLDVTVVLDPDEEVCRIGYGDIEALQHLQALACQNGFWLNSQLGLRVGVLLADDETLVWSPTPCSVEAPPNSARDSSSPVEAPNGLRLGADPAAALARAVAATGTDCAPQDAEVGRQAVTPQEVTAAKEALTRNPPIPVDLARVTRVFSNKLQFVELKVTGAKISKMKLSIPKAWLNADARGDLEGLIESRLLAFGELRDEEIKVPAYVKGEPALDAKNQPLMVPMSEAGMERVRHDIEKRYLYDIAGHGRLIEKDRKADFQKEVKAFEAQLLKHSAGVRQKLDTLAEQIVGEAMELICKRHENGRSLGKKLAEIDPAVLRHALHDSVKRTKDEEPKVTLVFKDVTYEQTQSREFHQRVDAALPPWVRKRLGSWTQQDTVARQRQDYQKS